MAFGAELEVLENTGFTIEELLVGEAGRAPVAGVVMRASD